MSALDSDILIRTEGRAGRITLNRPQALNALTHPMALKIEQALDAWRNDPAVELVIIDAVGDKAFCAGGDIQALYASGRAGDVDSGRTFWRDEYRLNLKIAQYPKPYVSVMQGVVMGGGVGISAHGSHRIVTEQSMIAMPETTIGFLPDVGGTLLLAQAPGRAGEYLALTGARMTGSDAIWAGFADLFVASDRLMELKAILIQGADALEDTEAAETTAEPPHRPRALWDIVREPPPSELAFHSAEINETFNHETLPEIIAAVDALPASSWRDKTAKALARTSPLSAAAALIAVRAARETPDLAQCLAREFRYAWRSVEQTDFLEGIRAAVIDKDRAPKWRAAGPGDAAALLAPLGDHELILETAS